MLGADKLGKFPLERGDLRTLRDPAAENDARCCVRLAAVHDGFDDRDHLMLFLFSRHHETRRCNPSSKSTVALKPKLLFGFGDISKPARNRIDLALGAVFRREIGSHHAKQCRGQFVEARLGAARDVEDLVTDVRLQSQDIGARDVVDVDKVHGRAAVAQNQRRFARSDPVHPSDQEPRCIFREGPCAARIR